MKEKLETPSLSKLTMTLHSCGLDAVKGLVSLLVAHSRQLQTEFPHQLVEFARNLAPIASADYPNLSRKQMPAGMANGFVLGLGAGRIC